jgi:CheY-like chemotaxis protein
MKTEDIVEILLVEDNPSDLELALHALKQNNLANHIAVARDGAEALEFIFATGVYAGRHLAKGPKVILLDLKLPKIDGLEVLQRVRANPLTSTIPIVILTSSHEERDIIESYKLGVNSYITKPINFDQFIETVRHLGYYWLLLNQAPTVT